MERIIQQNNRLASTKQDFITHKLKILEFYDKYSEGATIDAFGVSRNTVLLWKRKLKEHNYNPSPQSKKARMASQDSRVYQVEKMGMPRLGQYALKSELDELCAKKEK